MPLTSPFYVVNGDEVKGPFTDFNEAKSCGGIPATTFYTQRFDIGRGVYYRYGSKFIGRHDALVEAGIMESQNTPKKFVRFQTGVDRGNGPKVVTSGDWIPMPDAD